MCHISLLYHTFSLTFIRSRLPSSILFLTRLNRFALLHRVQIPRRFQQRNVPRRHARAVGLGAEFINHIHGKPDLERRGAVNLVELRVRELDTQRLGVALEVLDFAAADDGEDVRGLVHDVRQGDAGDERLLPVGDFLQRINDFALLLARLVVFAAFALELFALRRGFEVPPAERAPRAERHAFGFRHGQDVALEIAVRGTPLALVDTELGQAVVPRVLVGFADYPSGGITDA